MSNRTDPHDGPRAEGEQVGLLVRGSPCPMAVTQPNGCSNLRKCLAREPLLASTLLGVFLGVVAGVALRAVNPSERVLEVVGLPGEVLLRLLKMVVLPLVAGSMVAGVCALRSSTFGMGSVAKVSLLYYLFTTLIAVTLGLLVVLSIRPGRGNPFKEKQDLRQEHSQEFQEKERSADLLESVMDIIRDLFPSNAVGAAADMNTLGIITVSILFGLGLSAQGSDADGFVEMINIFNAVVEKVVVWILYYAPFGIFSLITHNIAASHDLLELLKSMGLYVVTVLVGLVLQACVILPTVHFLMTRKFPWKHYSGFSSAFVTAFGTDSSSATLPVTMRCAAEQGAHDEIIRFVLPLGATVNMNGTALYEAVTVVFIAQANGVHLSVANTIVVALVSTLAAVGAAGIPEAGLVTMLLVLKAVGMDQYAGDIGMILTIDWFLDRCRTVVNVLGDSVGVMAVNEVMFKSQADCISRLQEQESSTPESKESPGTNPLAS